LAEVGRLCGHCFDGAKSILTEIGELWPRLPEAFIPGRALAQRVSGSREPSTPLNLDAWDMYVDAPLGPVHDAWHDQRGQPSVSAVLASWVDDWAEQLGQQRGADYVPWLLARLEWAAKDYAGLVPFLVEIRSLRGRLVAVLREADPQPEYCRGVPCRNRNCDERNLFRRVDGSGDVDCHSCGAILGRAEYDEWCRRITAPAFRRWLTVLGAPAGST
jgi:hypothetical protein